MSDENNQALKKAVPVLALATESYEHRLNQFGDDARGVFWKNNHMQRQRYRIMVRIFDDIDQAGGIRIHDFGCGYGAFFDYLKDMNVMRQSRYIGTDISKQMIKAARSRIDDPRARFIRHLKATEIVDYTFVCGTYNMHMGSDEKDWKAYIEASLLGLWRTSRKGLVFNLLGMDATEKYDGLYYSAPQPFFDFCSTRLSTNVELSIDDHLPDWTLFIRRD